MIRESWAASGFWFHPQLAPCALTYLVTEPSDILRKTPVYASQKTLRRDCFAAISSGLQRRIQHALRLQRDFRPVRIHFATQHER